MFKNLEPGLGIFIHANGFLKAASLLRGKGLHDPNFDPSCFAVIATNIAFASELYLKCLIQLETGTKLIKEHNLFKLFEKLPPSAKQEIEKRYNARRHSGLPDPSTISDPKAARKVEKMRSLPFIDALKDGANAFVEWRYLYEDTNPGNRFDIGLLPTILRELILERRPWWSAAKVTMKMVPLPKPAVP